MLKLGAKAYEGTRKMSSTVTSIYRHELAHLADWVPNLGYSDNSFVRTRTALPRTSEGTSAAAASCRQGPYQQVVAEDGAFARCPASRLVLLFFCGCMCCSVVLCRVVVLFWVCPSAT
jgi:hypothetical protein